MTKFFIFSLVFYPKHDSYWTRIKLGEGRYMLQLGRVGFRFEYLNYDN